MCKKYFYVHYMECKNNNIKTCAESSGTYIKVLDFPSNVWKVQRKYWKVQRLNVKHVNNIIICSVLAFLTNGKMSALYFFAFEMSIRPIT